MNPGEVDAARFRWQMQLVAEHFNVLALSEALERLDRQQLPPQAACVTFDDGYADNVSVALPILQEAGICATFFVANGFLDGGRMWNDTVFEALRHASVQELDLEDLQLGCFALGEDIAGRAEIAKKLIKQLKYFPLPQRFEYCHALAERTGLGTYSDLMMRSEDVKHLASQGMEIGGHTVNHPILAVLDPEEARREIADNRDYLSDLVGGPIHLFAYPNGKPGSDYLPKHVEMVCDLGFRAALSTRWGACTEHSHRWQLPRFTPWDRTPLRFLARLQQNTWRTA